MEKEQYYSRMFAFWLNEYASRNSIRLSNLHAAADQVINNHKKLKYAIDINAQALIVEENAIIIFNDSGDCKNKRCSYSFRHGVSGYYFKKNELQYNKLLTADVSNYSDFLPKFLEIDRTRKNVYFNTEESKIYIEHITKGDKSLGRHRIYNYDALIPIDFNLPDKFIFEQIKLYRLIFDNLQTSDINLRNKTIDSGKYKLLYLYLTEKSRSTFDPSCIYPRVIGLWIWDYIKEKYGDNPQKRGSQTEARNAFKEEYKDILDKLQLNTKESRQYDLWYSITKNCIDACEVLPFTGKPVRTNSSNLRY